MVVESEIYSTYVPIGISIGAFIVSIVTFLVKRKDEEFRIALDLDSKIKEQSDEIVEAISKNEPPENIRYKDLEYLNTWKFFAFLVNKKVIKNKKIQNYFKPSLVSGAKGTLEDYPDVAKDVKNYGEIRTLLGRWGYEIQVKDSSKEVNDSQKTTAT